MDLEDGDETTNNSNSGSTNISYEQIVNIIYPIGRIIMTMANEDPNVLYSWQTWERTANGRFLLGASDSYDVGAVGGEANITLEEKHIPPHNHTISRGADNVVGTTWESYAPGSG